MKQEAEKADIKMLGVKRALDFS
jgi:hypothetical protein